MKLTALDWLLLAVALIALVYWLFGSADFPPGAG